MAIKAVFGLPFAEQIEFFRKKLDLPTERWDDIAQPAHDRAFVVAGAMKADLLADLHASILKHIGGGAGLEGYRKDFKAIVAKHGWTGWTGEGTPGGEAWRTRVTYMTNLRTSYAAGRYKQLTDNPNLRFWMWKHNALVAEPRAQHLAWDGMVLPADHPFWKRHYPPQIPPHWGCRCRVVGLSDKEAARRLGGDPDKALPDGWEKVDAKYKDPEMLARGANFAPGANVETSLRTLVQEKLIRYPDAIAGALTRDVTRWIDARTDVADFARQALDDAQLVKDLWLGFVVNDAIGAVAGANLRDYIVLLASDRVRHVEKSHGFDGGNQRAPRTEDYADAARWLVDGEVTPGKTVNGKTRIVARYTRGKEVIESVWEVRPGKRNRSLAFISMHVQVLR